MARLRLLVLGGVVLIVLGILTLVYDRFVFERTETRTLGPLAIEVPTQNEVRVPKPVGWILIVAGGVSLGAALLGAGRDQARP